MNLTLHWGQKKGRLSRLCENTLKVLQANAPTSSGRFALCGQQTKKGFSAHQRHQLTCAEHVNRSFQVISVHRQGHFGSRTLKLSQQEACVAK